MKLQLFIFVMLQTIIFCITGMDTVPEQLTIDQCTKVLVCEQLADGSNKIDLSNRGITSLTKVLMLKAKEKKTDMFPQDISSISNLNLDVSNNPITEFPKFLFPYRYLTALNLSGCNLQKIDKIFLSLSGLQTLDISHNQLEEIPEIHLNELQTLDISHNKFKKLPKLATSLRKLFANKNQIKDFDQEFLFVLVAAELVDLSCNEISQLPSFYSALRQFIQKDPRTTISKEELDHYRREFLRIDQMLAHIRGQVHSRCYTRKKELEFNCSHNHLTELPLDLSLFEFPTKVNCKHNQLSSIPDELRTTKLLTLDLSENPMTQQRPLSLDLSTLQEKRKAVDSLLEMLKKELTDNQEQETKVLGPIARLPGMDDTLIKYNAQYFSGIQQRLSEEIKKAEQERENLRSLRRSNSKGISPH